MKKYQKIIITALLWSLITIIFSAGIVIAQENENIKYKMQVGVPGTTFADTITMDKSGTYYIALFVQTIYQYGISVVAILAAVMIMAGGVIWLTSAGSQEKVGKAKDLIIGSLTGLILLFGSWVVLNTINPALVNFKLRDINTIKDLELGCCMFTDPDGTQKAKMTTTDHCSKLIKSNFWGPNYITRQEEFHKNFQGCYLINACCVVHVYRDIFGRRNVPLDEKTTYMKFPINTGGYNICLNKDKGSWINDFRVSSTRLSEPCNYEKTSDCKKLLNGDPCMDGSIIPLVGSRIMCNTEGVCGWCYLGSCVNTFGNSGDPCGGFMVGKCQTDCTANQAEFVSGRPCKSGLKCCSL